MALAQEMGGLGFSLYSSWWGLASPIPKVNVYFIYLFFYWDKTLEVMKPEATGEKASNATLVVEATWRTEMQIQKNTLKFIG